MQWADRRMAPLPYGDPENRICSGGKGYFELGRSLIRKEPDALPLFLLPPFPRRHGLWISPQALPDEFLIEVHAIGQDHISDRASILVETMSRSVTCFPKTRSEAACLACRSKAWPFSGQSISLRRIRSGW